MAKRKTVLSTDHSVKNYAHYCKCNVKKIPRTVRIVGNHKAEYCPECLEIIRTQPMTNEEIGLHANSLFPLEWKIA